MTEKFRTVKKIIVIKMEKMDGADGQQISGMQRTSRERNMEVVLHSANKNAT